MNCPDCGAPVPVAHATRDFGRCYACTAKWRLAWVRSEPPPEPRPFHRHVKACDAWRDWVNPEHGARR